MTTTTHPAEPAPALDIAPSLPDGPAVLCADEAGVLYLVLDNSGEEGAAE